MKYLWLLLLALPIMAQPPRASGVVVVFSAPSGNCAANSPIQRLGPSNALYGCLLPIPASLIGTWGAISGGASGTVTSVGFATNFRMAGGTPVTTSGILTLTVSAADIAAFLSATPPITLSAGGVIACATCSTTAGTVTHTGNLTADLPVFGNGTADIKVGTKSGNTNEVVTTTGSQTSGDCVQIDANGNHIDSGGTCGGGGGAPTVSLPPAQYIFGIHQQKLVAGSFTLGTKMYFTGASGSMKGIKFAWAGGAGALTVLVTLWDLGTTNSGGSSLGTATIAVNAANLYEADFSSPIALTQYHFYTMAFWENSGAQHTQAAVPITFPAVAYYSPANVLYIDAGLFSAGNGQPTSSASDRYPVEAVLQ